MKLRLPRQIGAVSIALALCVLPSLAFGADSNAAGETTGATISPANSAPSTSDDIAQLKAQLAAQQQQIEQLRLALEAQQKLLSRNSGTVIPAEEKQSGFSLPNTQKLGEVASASPILPPSPSPTPRAFEAQPTTSSANPCESENASPTFLRLGSTCLIPIGFMDATFFFRDKNAGSSIGSNFGSVPYNNTVNGRLSESRFSPQNSRVGFRFDGDWKGTHFIGYNEFDFLGTSGSNALTVTNGAFVPRLRLFWVDLRKGSWEFLAGQSWSMLTPNRSGISPLPGNIFFSQTIDVNYMAGLTWTRQPGFRVVYHGPNEKFAFGFAAENPDQYIGGSGGGSSIVLPAAFTALAGTQLDNAQNIGSGNTVLAAPTLHPDFIAKLAIDPTPRIHGEVAGIVRSFKIINPNNVAAGQFDTKTGGGIQGGLNVEVVKGLRLISTNYWSDGGGRYIFGQAPDVVVKADGTLGLVHSGGTVDGFEARIKGLLLYAYYGGILISRYVVIDSTGTPVGYGFTGSSNSQNRNVQEITFGFNQTLWSNPKYGAVNAMGQYEYLNRVPWFVKGGTPEGTHDNTIYFNLRYTLPGSMPSF
jgi:hypothetical protein